MKILWLNAGQLLPLDKGGKLRTWHLMRNLAARRAEDGPSIAPTAEEEAVGVELRVVDVAEPQEVVRLATPFVGVGVHVPVSRLTDPPTDPHRGQAEGRESSRPAGRVSNGQPAGIATTSSG